MLDSFPDKTSHIFQTRRRLCDDFNKLAEWEQSARGKGLTAMFLPPECESSKITLYLKYGMQAAGEVGLAHP